MYNIGLPQEVQQPLVFQAAGLSVERETLYALAKVTEIHYFAKKNSWLSCTSAYIVHFRTNVRGTCSSRVLL